MKLFDNNCAHKVFFILSIQLSLITSVNSQTLDQEYDFYLATKCRNLNFDRDGISNILPNQAGPNLFAFCNGPAPTAPPVPGTTINSTGGGAGAASSRDNGSDDAALRRRREELRQQESNPSQANVELLNTGNLGVFMSLDFQRSRQDVTVFEAGSQSDRIGFVIGADYRVGSTAVFGVALNQSSLSGDFTGGGNFEKDSDAVWLYSTWFPNNNFFLDFSIGLENYDQAASRLVGRQIVTPSPNGFDITFSPALNFANGNVDSDASVVDFRGGYDFVITALTVSPRFALVSRKTDIDSYIESGNTPMTLRFNRQSEKSQLGSLGIQASRAFSLPVGVINLQLNIDYLHEFKDDQRIITAHFAEDLRPNPVQLRFLNQAPDRDWYNSRVSATAVLSGGLNGFISIEQSFGHDYLEQLSASFGLRKEF